MGYVPPPPPFISGWPKPTKGWPAKPTISTVLPDEVFVPGGPVGRHVCVYCDALLVRDKRGRCRNCGGASAPTPVRPVCHVDPPDYIVK